MPKPRARPIVHLHCLCWNESAMIPHFLRHYRPWVDRFFIHDNGSTDGSLNLLRGDPAISVESFEVAGDSFVAHEQALSETMWKRSRGAADWVVVVDIDEFVFHPDPTAYLVACAEEGVTAIRGVGYEMVSDRLPTGSRPLIQTDTLGVRSLGYSKLCVFNPQRLETSGYRPGRHAADPTGTVRFPARPAMALLHYKMLGPDYLAARSRRLAEGIRPGDLAAGWGTAYGYGDDWWRATFDKAHAARHAVPGLPGGPPLDALWAAEADAAAKESFDPDWYLRTYPDVGREGFDPLSHYVLSGRGENRLPNGVPPPGFDPDWYLRAYPEVREAGVDPVLHWHEFGRAEGRRPNDRDGIKEAGG